MSKIQIRFIPEGRGSTPSTVFGVFDTRSQTTEAEYFPGWLVGREDLPAEIRDAKATADEAKAEAIRLHRVYSAAATKHRTALAEERAREAAGGHVNGDRINALADAMTESAKAHHLAGLAHVPTLQTLVDVWDAHRPALRDLAGRAALEHHAEVVERADGMLTAITAREAAYRFAGSPGERATGKPADGDGTKIAPLYWGSRRDAAVLYSTGQGTWRNDFQRTLDKVRTMALAFPVEHITMKDEETR